MVSAADRDRLGTRDVAIGAVRIIAVLAGIALHAAVPYVTRPVPELLWSVRDPAAHGVADVVFWWGRFAQVQLLFFVAGMLTVRAYAARGPSAFVAARLRRLGVPLLAGLTFVLPLVAMVWAWGWVATERATWAEVWTWRFRDPELQRNSVGPAHLWFLEDLLLMTVAIAALWRAGLFARAARFAGSAVTLAVLLASGVALLWWRPEIVLTVPNSFVPDPARVAYGLTFVAGGAWFAVRPRPARWPSSVALIALGGVATAAAIAATSAAGSERHALLVAVTVAAAGWCTVLGCVRVVSARVTRLPAWGQRLAGVAYAVYIVHLPVVGLFHILILGSIGNALVVMLIVFALTLAVSWAASEAAMAIRARLRVPVLQPLTAGALTAAVVAIGIGLRLLHYLRNPDVWHDEAAVLVNVIERDYTSLLGPLTFHEAAPPLFLWLERWIAVSVSDSTWAMRFAPLVASCLALVALVPVARRLRSVAAPVALVLMACSTQLIAHSVEAKPYAIDVFVATAAAAFVVTTRAWPMTWRMATAAAMAPLVIFVSYPGIFVMVGVASALAVANLERRSRAAWAIGAVLVAIAIVCLAVLVTGPVRAQRSPTILADWRWAFPQGSDPIALAIWLVRSLVGLADYCFRPFGGVLLVPIGFGLAALWRRGERPLVVLLVVPIALALVAGLAGQYPFSGSRVMIYALPALAVLCAEGLARIADLVRDRSPLLHATVAALIVLPPAVLSARDTIGRDARAETAASAAFVLAARQPGEPVASGYWESRYYFRRLGSEFIRLDERPLPPNHDRIWCVVHGPTPDDRQRRLAGVIGSGYQIVRSGDFVGVSVIELGGRR
jgi:peptidoglycan/LPS O-acetylase OafA/YrhL